MGYQAASGVQKPGEKYRVISNIRAPYTIENIEKLEDEWRRRSISASITITSFRAFYPKNGVWSVEVYYRVNPYDPTGPFKLFADDVSRLTQTIVGGVINSLALVGVQIEKEVVTAAGVAGQAAAAAIQPIGNAINPGVLILVVLGIFLITKRG